MSAVISNCGKYRYSLHRQIGPDAGRAWGPHVLWIMVNPSTADALKDDATIRKLRGFTQRMGAQRFTVGNLFAYRATDIKQLRTALDPIGPDNDMHLRAMLANADRVMVAWGPTAKLPPWLRDRFRFICDMAAILNVKLHCLGTAKDGQPYHPLMRPYSDEIVEWTQP